MDLISSFHSCFSYLISKLLDPDEPWWVVDCTKMAANTFLLFDVYDLGRLWALIRKTIQDIRILNLKTVFENEGNEGECLTLIDAI